MAAGSLIKRPCPRCKRVGLRQRRTCCAERKRLGYRFVVKCQHCGYQEAVK